MHPAILAVAGRGSDSLAQAAQNELNRHQLGPATHFASAAGATNLLLEAVRRGQTLGYQWLGGPDTATLEVFGGLAKHPAVTGRIFPVFDLLLVETNRSLVRRHLQASRSPGVQSLLATHELPVRQFVPVGQPGGQPLEAVIVLTALLYEREQLSPTLATELRSLSEKFQTEDAQATTLEEAYLHLLILARRFDWTSLGMILKSTPDIATLNVFAEAIRTSSLTPSHQFAATVWSGNPGRIAEIQRLGPGGQSALKAALEAGVGAVRWLAAHPRTLNTGGPHLEMAATAAIHSPGLILGIRWTLFLVSACFLSLGIRAWGQSDSPAYATRTHAVETSRPGRPVLPVGFVGIVTALTLILLSEPGLVQRLKPPAYDVRLDTPRLTEATPLPQTQTHRKVVMEWSTIASIAFFAALQIGVYIICLRKIREIENLLEEPLLKLRLLENEENLFDAGLYVGIGGTATALVLQVLGLIEANLLAAYSSNLMGIIGVALVKIRHVRPYKRALILEGSNNE